MLRREQQIELKYSPCIDLHPQWLNCFFAAFSPLLHRFIAANPQPNPQIFRAFSASFAHAAVRKFFRSLCAAISQPLAGSAGKKNGEKEANGRCCGKTFAVRRSQFAARFSAVTRGTDQ